MTVGALRKKYPPERLAKIRKLFDQDVQWWSAIKKEADEDMQCISTERGPWPLAEWDARHAKGTERPCIHEDVITQYVNTVVNEIEANPRGIKVQPESEGADEASAEFVENRIRQIEYEQNGSYAYLTAAKNAVERSYGWWKMETAYDRKFDQKCCILPILDPDTIVPSFWKKPGGSDMRRCWELERMSHEEFREKYPNAKYSTFDGLNPVAPKWVDDTTIQVAAWWHIEEDERELLSLDDGTERGIHVYADEFDKNSPVDETKIRDRRQEKQRRVFKTIFNGVEALDETEWLDPGDGDDHPPEIPIFLVTGRTKYEKGVLIIESLVRKGRVGQLLYDYVLSTTHEVTAITGKPVRTGPEGTFDTGTNWNPRDITAYKEWKAVTGPDGQVLPPPVFEMYEPPISELLALQQSILIGIQNAIGMSSTERKDRVAKSGKALEALSRDMAISTAHYFNSVGMAQERMYRMINRMLPLIENTERDVGLRDVYGKHKVVPLDTGIYKKRHAVVIGSGKLYQSQQDEQSDFADELLKIADPNVLMAVLPGAIRMKGLGEWGDELAKKLEAIQPAPMQAVQQAKDIPPQAMQMIQQTQQQLQALHNYSKQLEQQLIQLNDEKQGKVVENQGRAQLERLRTQALIELQRMKDATAIEVARIGAKASAMQTHEELTSEENIALAEMGAAAENALVNSEPETEYQEPHE